MFADGVTNEVYCADVLNSCFTLLSIVDISGKTAGCDVEVGASDSATLVCPLKEGEVTWKKGDTTISDKVKGYTIFKENNTLLVTKVGELLMNKSCSKLC